MAPRCLHFNPFCINQRSTSLHFVCFMLGSIQSVIHFSFLCMGLFNLDVTSDHPSSSVLQRWLCSIWSPWPWAAPAGTAPGGDRLPWPYVGAVWPILLWSGGTHSAGLALIQVSICIEFLQFVLFTMSSHICANDMPFCMKTCTWISHSMAYLAKGSWLTLNLIVARNSSMCEDS